MEYVDICSPVRRVCLKDGVSVRSAARYFNKDREMPSKMLRHELPWGYRRSEPARRPMLDGYVDAIDKILRTNKNLIEKHCANEVFVPLSHRQGYAQIDFG